MTVTVVHRYWTIIFLLFVSSVCLSQTVSDVRLATVSEVFGASQQSGVISTDPIKTLVAKLIAAHSESERDALLSQNSQLLTPELNQLFVEQAREHFKQGNLPAAVAHFEIAKTIAAKIDDKLRMAQALTTLGNLYRLLGKDETALARLHQASPIHEVLGNKQGSFFTLLNIVMIEISANNYDETNVQKLMSMAAESKRDDWIALSLSQLGMMQFLKGNYPLAMESHLKSLALYERSTGTEGVAFALHAIGIIERVYGNYESALEYFQKSQALNEILKRKDLYSRTLSSIGDVYGILGNQAQALEYYQKAVSFGEVSGSKFWKVFSLTGIGEIYRAQGNFEQALVHLQTALKLSEELGYKDRTAYVCLAIGEIKYLQHDYLKTLEFAKRALTISSQTGSRDLQWKALTQAGKASNALNQSQTAERLLKEATNAVELLRSTVVGDNLRSSYFATVQQPYELYIDVLMQRQKVDPNSNHAALALQINERRLARSLLEMLTEANTDIRRSVDPQLLEREISVQRQLNAIAARQMREPITDEKALALKKEIDALSVEYQRVEADIKQRSPHYASLTKPVTLTVEQIQSGLLDSETALLEYSLGADRSYVWLVTATSLNSFELPGRVQIETSARKVAKLLDAGERWVTDSQIRSQFEDEAAKLSSTLLPAALVSQLRVKRLLIVGDGALQYVPFGVLPIVKTPSYVPLIANYEIVSLPSASTLAVLRRETQNRQPLGKGIAVIADPVFEETDDRLKNRTDVATGETQSQGQENLRKTQRILRRAFASDPGDVRESRSIKRLPFSRFEAEGILNADSSRLTLKAIDFRANREMATSGELASYRYVHFATHGILNSEHPELSGIVLSLLDEQGKPIDGFLRLHDIYNLNLQADLVVLSACQTGLGKEIRGEGLVGLTRGFMYAGAPRVVASLWKVDDAATAELMKRFYTAMLKDNLRPAAALRRAKVEMWKQKRWEAPFYWAAFELQGEWR